MNYTNTKDTWDINHSVILQHLKLRARLPKHIWLFPRFGKMASVQGKCSIWNWINNTGPWKWGLRIIKLISHFHRLLDGHLEHDKLVMNMWSLREKVEIPMEQICWLTFPWLTVILMTNHPDWILIIQRKDFRIPKWSNEDLGLTADAHISHTCKSKLLPPLRTLYSYLCPL